MIDACSWLRARMVQTFLETGPILEIFFFFFKKKRKKKKKKKRILITDMIHDPCDRYSGFLIDFASITVIDAL